MMLFCDDHYKWHNSFIPHNEVRYKDQNIELYRAIFFSMNQELI